MTELRPVPNWVLLAIFVGLLALYGATDPGNRFESIDGYDYAQAAEIVPLELTYDSRSILFHKINRVAFVASQALGLPYDAHRVIRTLCMLSAAASVLLMLRLAARGLGLSWATSWLAAATLAVSYGFWRYAVEVEVYLPSIFLILLTFCILLDGLDAPELRPGPFLLAGALGGLACLYYQANFVPMCLAAPVMLLRRDRIKALLWYGAAGTIVSVGGVIAAYVASESTPLTPAGLAGFLGMRFNEFHPGRTLAATVFGSVVAIVHDVASLNWLYGMEFFRSAVERAVPSHFARLEGVSEAALRFKPYIYVAIVLLPLIVAILIDAFITLIRYRLRPVLSRRQLFLWVWLGANLLMNGYLGASEPEVWVTTLPALLLALSILLIEPVMAADKSRWLPLLPVLLLLHNLLAGLGMFRHDDGLHARRTAWLARNLASNDVVLVNMADQRIWNYLRYKLGATLIYSDGDRADVAAIDGRFRPETGPLDEMLKAVAARGGRIYTMGDLSRPAPAMARRVGEAEYRAALVLARRLEGRMRLVHEDAAVSIYAVRP
jgi:hypothetical protein